MLEQYFYRCTHHLIQRACGPEMKNSHGFRRSPRIRSVNVRGCFKQVLRPRSGCKFLLVHAVEKPLCGEGRSAAAALGAVGVDEVEALTHEGLFEVEGHAGEVEETLGVDEDADALGVLLVLPYAVALAGLRVEADVIAEAGAAASGDAEAQASLFGGDVLFLHGSADAF